MNKTEAGEHSHDAVPPTENSVRLAEGIVTISAGYGQETTRTDLSRLHWLYAVAEDGSNLPPPMGLRCGLSNANDRRYRDVLARHVANAVRYGLKSATLNGRLRDFDPDALVENTIIGLFGHPTDDGLETPRSAEEKVPRGLHAVLNDLIGGQHELAPLLGETEPARIRFRPGADDKVDMPVDPINERIRRILGKQFWMYWTVAVHVIQGSATFEQLHYTVVPFRTSFDEEPTGLYRTTDPVDAIEHYYSDPNKYEGIRISGSWNDAVAKQGVMYHLPSVDLVSYDRS